MGQRYVPIFFDWTEVTKELNAQEKGRLIDAIILYARGEDMQDLLKGNERYLFPAFMAQIDRSNAKQQLIAERNRANGAKGGRPRKTQKNPEKPSGFYGNPKEEEYKEENEELPRDTIEAYVSANIDRLSGGNFAELATFIEDLPEDIIRYAVDEACANGARSWSYVRAILNKVISKGYKTLGEIKAASARKTQQQNAAQTERPNPLLNADFY